MLRDAWETHASQWIAWARAPGHDSYWRFHRDAFLPLVPPPGRLTLDVGCGEGRVGRDLARLGHRVVGVDASMTLARAAQAHLESGGPVIIGDAARLPLPTGAADCAVAFMSLQDVDDMEAAAIELSRVLSAGGRLAMAIVHPFGSAGRFGASDGSDPPSFVLEGSYFERRSIADTCERGGFTMTFHSEHRPLSAYTDALAMAGFVVERIQEVTEPDPAHRWHGVPMFLDLRATRL
jgi:SAM-dependent methyltransferase